MTTLELAKARLAERIEQVEVTFGEYTIHNVTPSQTFWLA